MPASGYLALRPEPAVRSGLPGRPWSRSSPDHAVIRGLVLAYIVAQVLIWSSFYTAGPARLARPAAAAACCVVAVVYLRRRRPARR